MCGIGGIIGKNDKNLNLPNHLAHMGNAMHHRGPDNQGVWIESNKNIGFVHRRLSIIDTQQGSNQPMFSSDGRYVITFNGEIYNYQELKSELTNLGSVFKTNSDTEVILEAYRHFSTGCFHRFDGMFALAMYDTHLDEFVLARDAFGEKPIYYTNTGDYFSFASELSGLKNSPSFDSTISKDSIAEYLCFQYIGAPHTIYESAYKLGPGEYAKIDQNRSLSIFKYFDYKPGELVEKERDMDDYVDELESLLTTSLRRRLISDVPLGAFLSGGVDSSVTVGMISSILNRDIKTFSAGFSNTEETEHLFARHVAEHCGTKHKEIMLNIGNLDMISRLGKVMDEPNGDSSCLPTYLLSEFIKKDVTVAVSGDGGDEIFGGYGRYTATLSELSEPNFNLGKRYYSSRILVIEEDRLQMLYGNIPLRLREKLAQLRHEMNSSKIHPLHRMRSTDISNYLPGAVLPKVDKMAMQHSLEVRTPFLSMEIARFAERLPLNCFFSNGEGKFILKKLGERYVPKSILYRKKMGFGLPMSSWAEDALRTELRKKLLGQDSRLRDYVPENGLAKFVAHLETPGYFSTYQAWSILVLEEFLRNQEKEKHQDAMKRTPIILPTLNVDQNQTDMNLDILALDTASAAILISKTNVFPVINLNNPNLEHEYYLYSDHNNPPFTKLEKNGKSEFLPENFIYKIQGKSIFIDLNDIPFNLDKIAKNKNAIYIRHMGKWLAYVAMTMEKKIKMVLSKVLSKVNRGTALKNAKHEGGYCYKINVHEYYYLTEWLNKFSFLRSWITISDKNTLFLDFKDSSHDVIRYIGLGSRSLWNDEMYFSLSDNTSAAESRTLKLTLIPRWLQEILTVENSYKRIGSENQKNLLNIITEHFSNGSLKKVPKNGSVAIITSDLSSGGAERQACYLAVGLSKKGYEVSLICTSPLSAPKGQHFKFLLEGHKINLVDLCTSKIQWSATDFQKNANLLNAVSALPSYLKLVKPLVGYLSAFQPTVVHSFLDYPNIVAGVAAVLTGCPKIILSARNLNPTHFHFDQPWFYDFYRTLINCKSVIPTGNSLAGNRDYESWLGLPENTFKLIENGIMVDYFDIPDDKKTEKKSLLGVFRLSDEKRPFIFIDVAEKLILSDPSIEVVHAGTGALEAEFISEIDRRGLTANFRVMGNNSEVQGLMKQARVMLLTSSQEGTPNVLIEAQVLGLPCVCTDVGGCAEVVINNKTGFVCEKNNVTDLVEKCRLLLKDDNLHQTFSTAAISINRPKYDIENSLRQVLDVYEIQRPIEI